MGTIILKSFVPELYSLCLENGSHPWMGDGYPWASGVAAIFASMVSSTCWNPSPPRPPISVSISASVSISCLPTSLSLSPQIPFCAPNPCLVLNYMFPPFPPHDPRRQHTYPTPLQEAPWRCDPTEPSRTPVSFILFPSSCQAEMTP